ncbi:MAG: hypothetical protein PVH87_05075 [Desulfobacteraceae bacterium]
MKNYDFGEIIPPASYYEEQIVKKESALRLMEIYSQAGAILNQADPILRDIPDEEERISLLRSLGGVMADIWIKLESPIVRQFPDLDPDEGTEWLDNLKMKRASRSNSENIE